MKKHILLTGATDGIGKLAAQKLAQEGHELYLHGRNAHKLSQLIEEMKAASQNESIRGFVCDFSELKAVEKMAEEVIADVPQLDILINNAGVYNSPIALNSNGLDIRFVVNYLAPYMLTDKLIPLFTKSLDPRILNLSSAAQAPVSLEALAGHTQISEQAAYAQSKLALTMWSFQLARKHPHMSILAVNPGSLLNTNMVREAFGRFWAPADKGAQILYDLAIAERYKGKTGKYFDNDAGSFGYPHADADDPTKVQALIEKTDQILASV